MTSDEDLLPRLNPARVAQSLEGSAGGGGYSCRALEGEICRLEREHVLSGKCVLGKGAGAGTEDLVAGLELRHVLADRLDHPCDINTPNTRFGRAEPEADDAHQVGLPGHNVPVTDVEACSVDPYEYVVEPDLRLVDLLELEYVRRAVAVLNDRLHRCRLSLELR